MQKLSRTELKKLESPTRDLKKEYLQELQIENFFSCEDI